MEYEKISKTIKDHERVQRSAGYSRNMFVVFLKANLVDLLEISQVKKYFFSIINFYHRGINIEEDLKSILHKYTQNFSKYAIEVGESLLFPDDVCEEIIANGKLHPLYLSFQEMLKAKGKKSWGEFTAILFKDLANQDKYWEEFFLINNKVSRVKQWGDVCIYQVALFLYHFANAKIPNFEERSEDWQKFVDIRNNLYVTFLQGMRPDRHLIRPPKYYESYELVYKFYVDITRKSAGSFSRIGNDYNYFEVSQMKPEDWQNLESAFNIILSDLEEKFKGSDVSEDVSISSNTSMLTMNEDNGYIFWENNKIGEVKLGTPHYYFLEFLIANIDVPMSYEKILESVKKSKTQRDKNKRPSDLCQDIKYELKTDFPDIDKFISPRRDKDGSNGYILQLPTS